MKTMCERTSSIGSIYLLLALVAAIFTVFSGCGEKPMPRIGETPPAISCNDLYGEYISLNRLKGNVVVLYFWSSSCCRDRLKQLERYYSLNKNKGLSIVAIEVGGSDNSVKSFATNNGVSFTMLTDEHKMIFRQYGIIGFPTIFILDRNGIIRKKILGDTQTAQLSKLISQLL